MFCAFNTVTMTDKDPPEVPVDKRKLNMQMLYQENQNLSAQLAQLTQLVNSRLPPPPPPPSTEVQDNSTAGGSGVASTPGTGDTGDTGNVPEPTDTSTENGPDPPGHTGNGTGDADPPAKRARVSVASQSSAPTPLTVDLTDEEQQRTHVQGLINRDSIGQAMGLVMGAEYAQSGELFNNFMVAGSTLDERLRAKIISDQYVDLTSLLPRAQQGGFVQLSDSGTLQFNPMRPRAPGSFMEWLKLFCIYASTYVDTHPHYGSQLFSYIIRIATISQENPNSYLWRQYDEDFRRMRKHNTALPWHLTNTHILSQAAETIRDIARANARRQQRQQPQTSANKPVSHDNSTRSKWCFDYNDPTKHCQRRNCRYLHVCSKCSGNHPAPACKVQTKKQPASTHIPKPAPK